MLNALWLKINYSQFESEPMKITCCEFVYYCLTTELCLKSSYEFRGSWWNKVLPKSRKENSPASSLEKSQTYILSKLRILRASCAHAQMCKARASCAHAQTYKARASCAHVQICLDNEFRRS